MDVNGVVLENAVKIDSCRVGINGGGGWKIENVGIFINRFHTCFYTLPLLDQINIMY